MGCASSKGLGNEFAAEMNNAVALKAIAGSLPSLPRKLTDDFHVVALTSSTYGILKVEGPKLPEEELKDGATAAAGAHSVKDVLSKLSLESKVDTGPQSWLEVSSMLENLKPELAKSASAKTGSKPQQLDAVDVKEIMLDLDEDTGLVRPKARQIANLKKAGKSLPIRTLEELDKRLGSKVNDVKNAISSPAMTIAEARASLKPVGSVKSTVSVEEKPANVVKPAMKEHKLSPARAVHAEETRTVSELVDGDFLHSYQNAVKALTEDDWKVVEAFCITDAVPDTHHDSEDGEIDIDCESADVEQIDDYAAKNSFESDDIFSFVEDEENYSSSLNGSSVATSSSLDLSALMSDSSPASIAAEDDVDQKSPLEEYEELCPPGGKDGLVLYVTSMRSIRRTYEDCSKAREILKRYGVMIDERDVAMHLEYRNELRELMQRMVSVPRLFVKGRYIGGTEVIAKLEEEGQLGSLFEGTVRGYEGAACIGCVGAKFVPCLDCSGSRKLVNDKKQVVQCTECNENGLIHCPICS